MRRLVPDRIYLGKPCSVVALGCAMHVSDPEALMALYSPSLRADGYLSLDGMNRLIRAHTRVIRRVNYRRGERPCLRKWAHEHLWTKAVICVEGHFVYFDGHNYHSFLWNGDDEVITVWILEDKNTK